MKKIAKMDIPYSAIRTCKLTEAKIAPNCKFRQS